MLQSEDIGWLIELKTRPIYILLTKAHFSAKVRLKMKVQKKTLLANEENWVSVVAQTVKILPAVRTPRFDS